jgi:hypothetical protein
MAANTALKVTELDFDTIREGIKDYIKTKPEFIDYNFEGSVISLLLDMLAHNTYQNAFLTSMVGNEMFLDSALLRDSVVSRAKMLGYTTRSARGSSTQICLELTPNPLTPAPLSITVPKNTEFTTIIDGIEYTWVTPENYIIYDNNGIYEGIVTIVEGNPLTQQYTVNSVNPVRYIIPNENIDTTSITVTVQETVGSTNIETFSLAENILDVNKDSAVYFIQEINDNLYEIYFGDGVIGKQLNDGNIVNISYRVCNGSTTNGVDTFIVPTTIPGADVIGSVVEDKTSGGDEIESVESVKFNAPRYFETQDRAVLATDYKSLLLKQFGDLKSVSVWGGEENDQPIYGKVFISGRTENSTFLSQQKKDEIKQYLKKYNVMAMDIRFVDPTYLYIKPIITIYYDSKQTSLSPNALATSIETTIQNFETTNLGTFEKNNLRYSNFSSAIDNTDISIQNNISNLLLQKRFTPDFSNNTTYTLNFQNALEICRNDGSSTISSTSFTLSGKTTYLDDDGKGNVRTYYLGVDGVTKVYVNNTQGTIDYTTGKIQLINFKPTAATNDQIEVSASSNSYDINSNRYQILLLSGTTFDLRDISGSTAKVARTVNTIGDATQINEVALGTVV